METDSLPSAPVFLAFLLLFSYLSLVEHSRNARGAFVRNGWPPRWTGPLLPFFKYASVIAVALSGLALVHSMSSMGWWPGSLLSLGLLMALWAIDRTTGYAASRYPTLATGWYRPLFQVLRGPRGRDPTSVEGSTSAIDPNESFGEIPTDSEEPVITEADLISLDQRDREMLRSISAWTLPPSGR